MTRSFPRLWRSRLRTEVQSGIQTIQYQLITLMTCNGQAPFVTMFMYLDEVPEGQTRDDLAMLIEEALLPENAGRQERKRRVDHAGVPETGLCAG